MKEIEIKVIVKVPKGMDIDTGELGEAAAVAVDAKVLELMTVGSTWSVSEGEK